VQRLSDVHGSKKSTPGRMPTEKHKIKLHTLEGSICARCYSQPVLAPFLAAVAAFTQAPQCQRRTDQAVGEPQGVVMPAGDYANQDTRTQSDHRSQCRKCRWHGRSRPACCAPRRRTADRRHTMYVHTPFPNKVYALDLANENKIIWKYEPTQDPNVIPVMCATPQPRRGVWRRQDLPASGPTQLVALDAKTGRSSGRQERRSSKGSTGTRRRGGQGQGSGRHFRR